jgi:hypothetical protein
MTATATGRWRTRRDDASTGTDSVRLGWSSSWAHGLGGVEAGHEQGAAGQGEQRCRPADRPPAAPVRPRPEHHQAPDPGGRPAQRPPQAPAPHRRRSLPRTRRRTHGRSRGSSRASWRRRPRRCGRPGASPRSGAGPPGASGARPAPARRGPTAPARSPAPPAR